MKLAIDLDSEKQISFCGIGYLPLEVKTYWVFADYNWLLVKLILGNTTFLFYFLCNINCFNWNRNLSNWNQLEIW